jgi:acetyltransferase
MVIYSYPTQPVSQWQLADGTHVTIRPIRPEDAELVKKFVHDLSEESKYFRFMNSLHELTEAMLVRFTQLDHSREIALIAVTSVQDEELELGVARFAINPDAESCEFALVVADKFTGKGLGHKLMLSLMDAARAMGLKTIEGEILSANHNMLKLMSSLGFTSEICEEDRHIVKVSKSLWITTPPIP